VTTENWDEFRTAYFVAKVGTVSGAADLLGVHHATVIRHIDALEARLGARLFQRHARGYTPTEAGSDLFKVTQATEEQFLQLVSRIKGAGDAVTGELVITTVAGMSPLLTPVLARFSERHPDVVLRFVADNRVFRLEYGEAHVAIRAGAIPQEQDNVVQPLVTLGSALCAAPSYIARHGRPESPADFSRHRWVSHDNESFGAPWHRWLRERVPASAIAFRATENEVMEDAVAAGVGLGFIGSWRRGRLPGLVEIMPPIDDWQVRLWLVTHVDLHRTSKVQAFLKFMKDEARAWHR
jgi:DNA-binding transcriptional LysR family regulator